MVDLNSVRVTYFVKKIVPAVFSTFFGVLSLVIAYGAFWGQPPHKKGLLLIALLPLACAYLVNKRFNKDLVDEIHEVGGELLVKNANLELKIPFSKIKEVVWTPEYAKIVLLEKSVLGEELKFIPKDGWQTCAQLQGRVLGKPVEPWSPYTPEEQRQMLPGLVIFLVIVIFTFGTMIFMSPHPVTAAWCLFETILFPRTPRCF